jgi:hypothetical protein
VQLVEAWRLEAARVAVAGGDEQRDRLGLEAPRGEHERLGRRAVEPLGVVDAAQHRRLLARLGEQAEHAERHQEAVRHAVEAQAQRAPERRGLRRREPLDQVDARAQELVDTCERQLVLGLDADAAQDPHPVRAGGGVVEQGGLADTRVAADDEHRAALIACALKQRIETALLSVTPDEHSG